ncbi:hypothetical protein NMY22_g14860 [Coprinellus aureogranulatus]|nr:hypothetical protein NMY22_g14860 [Coprinellus aureogranulatus]
MSDLRAGHRTYSGATSSFAFPPPQLQLVPDARKKIAAQRYSLEPEMGRRTPSNLYTAQSTACVSFPYVCPSSPLHGLGVCTLPYPSHLPYIRPALTPRFAYKACLCITEGTLRRMLYDREGIPGFRTSCFSPYLVASPSFLPFPSALPSVKDALLSASKTILCVVIVRNAHAPSPFRRERSGCQTDRSQCPKPAASSCVNAKLSTRAEHHPKAQASYLLSPTTAHTTFSRHHPPASMLLAVSFPLASRTLRLYKRRPVSSVTRPVLSDFWDRDWGLDESSDQDILLLLLLRAGITARPQHRVQAPKNELPFNRSLHSGLDAARANHLAPPSPSSTSKDTAHKPIQPLNVRSILFAYRACTASYGPLSNSDMPCGD